MSDTVQTVPCTLAPATFERLIELLGAEVELVPPATAHNQGFSFQVWVGGVETVHRLFLGYDGTWTASSEVPI